MVEPLVCKQCCHTQKECRCLTCCCCEGEFHESKNMIGIVKRRKFFCRVCCLSVCTRCISDRLCKECVTKQAEYNDLWRNLKDLDPCINSEEKEKGIENMFRDMIEAVESKSNCRLQSLLQYCGEEYLKTVDADNRTLFYHAVVSGARDIINVLASQGSDVNHVDCNGNTVLHYLSANSRPKIGYQTEELIKLGVDVFMLNNKGQTALNIAIKEENLKVQNVLEKSMYKASQKRLEHYCTKNDLPSDISACLRYILSKIKVYNPFDIYVAGNMVKRQRSVNHRCMAEKKVYVEKDNNVIDPYEMKKIISESQIQIMKLEEQNQLLSRNIGEISVIHRSEKVSLQEQIDSLVTENEVQLNKQKKVFENHVLKLSIQLQEAKELEFEATAALDNVVHIQKQYRLSWVPKSVTGKCGEQSCLKKFKQEISMHHCRCCGRVFCSPCTANRIKVPFYGYYTPVRVCKYCFDLLDDTVLCDFDDTDIDEQQWQSVHIQTSANPENLGKRDTLFRTHRSKSLTLSMHKTKRGSSPSSFSISPSTLTSSEHSSKAPSIDEQSRPVSEMSFGPIINNNLDVDEIYTNSDTLSETSDKSTRSTYIKRSVSRFKSLIKSKPKVVDS